MLLKRLLNNWLLKLISLFLAFLLWFLVVEIGDPKDDQNMGNVVVRLTNTQLLDEENKVYEVLDGTNVVGVTVYAPKSVLSQIRSSDITAEADISKLTDINTVPIDFSVSTVTGATVTGSHDYVKLNIEEKASKYVSLSSKTTGDVAEGFAVTNLTPDQNRIEVSGPKSIVDQIRYAGAEIDVTDATSNLTANVDISLYNVQGEEIDQSKISKNVNHVKMSVEVLAVKEVPLQLGISGDPEQGYMVSGEPVADVSVVKLAGSVYTLSRVSFIAIPSEVLDMTGATEDKTFTFDIREYLPDNTKLADNTFSPKITVTVPVEQVVERSLKGVLEEIAVSNVPSGYEVEISTADESTYTLEVSGLKEDIEALRQSGIKGKIDVGAWMEEHKIEKLRIGSTYTVPVTFEPGENVTIKNEVTVKISIKESEE
ncbi:MAG: hypothetical protein IJ716_08000 [Lachnospiraceae bacterium]|nr:hypothetical protein [Lachnospiraceae bacterium]